MNDLEIVFALMVNMDYPWITFPWKAATIISRVASENFFKPFRHMFFLASRACALAYP